MRYIFSFFLLLVLNLYSGTLFSSNNDANQQAVNRLINDSNGTAKLSFNQTTGVASYVRVEPGSLSLIDQTDEAMARDFFQKYGNVFGITNQLTELLTNTVKTDRLGTRSVKFQQTFQGVPVFASDLRVHFDATNKLTTVNGIFVPNINVTTVPLFTIDTLTDKSLNLITEQFPDATGLSVAQHILYVYRQGLIQRTTGADHLVYEIEITNGNDVREFVYIDANTGKVVNQITGIYDALDRRAFDAQNFSPPYPNYPASPFWVEGDSIPTGTTEADNMIFASGETYDFFFNGFGRDSFDGNGATMDAIFNRGDRCPNASWNGVFISFCPGVTTDDITAHEWGHAYTEYTHGLIYQWQPGALNEAYSDIWGETVDLINNRGTDSPAPIRPADSCSLYGGAPAPLLTITGGNAAGAYSVTATGSRPVFGSYVNGPIEMALSNPSGGCSAIDDVSGKTLIIDYTLLPNGDAECSLETRTINAYNANANGIIFVAPLTGPVNLTEYLSVSVQVSYADGETIKSGLPASATMEFLEGTEDSLRWLQGEDASGFGGAIRDMWNPNCYNDPGKVTDTIYYKCSTSDQGGVHTNSGIPNHEFALLVDGGTYNGQTITPIGLIKATNIFYRAMTNYQGIASGFPEHADAMDASCEDLRVAGTNLPDLLTGLPSGEIISASDCAQVANAILATELRTEPTFCNFGPLLAPEAPVAFCDTPILEETFELDPTANWTLTNTGVFASYTPRDWAWSNDIPSGGTGMAMFAINSPSIGNCADDEQSGAMHLDSPILIIPEEVTNASVTFDHWVATEVGYDGGNIKISVNNGPFQVIDPADFIFNSYNSTLISAPGNTNPLASEFAFTGTNAGQVDGSWGQSQVLLNNYVNAGDEIQLRFDLGVDGCSGAFGWYVDNVNVCADFDTLNIYTVSGTVTGLAEGSSLSLENNDTDIQIINQEISLDFSFSRQADATPYEITVSSSPTEPNQTCTIAGGENNDGSGTIFGDNVTNITVNCIDDFSTAQADTGMVLEEATATIIDVLNNDSSSINGAFPIISVTQPANGMVNITNAGADLSYVPNADYCNDGGNTDDFTYTITGDSVASVAMTVTCVNDEPNFIIEDNIYVKLSDKTNPLAENVACGFDMGPDDEDLSQTVNDFFITVDSDPNGILSTLDVMNDGSLSATYTGNQGIASISLTLQDNGGTNNSGDDSITQQFKIHLQDYIFRGGFDIQNCE